MKNTITFLGTSHGDPSVTRFCSSTHYAIDGTTFLIDAGEPVSALLIRRHILPSSLDAVFLTHMHLDHVNGLAHLYYEIEKYPGKRVEMFFAEEKAIGPFMQWNEAMHNHPLKEECLRLAAVTENFLWQKNTLSVRSIPTDHMGEKGKSFAYMIATPSCKILHTGDLSGNFHDFPLAPGDPPVDLCVCEATHIWHHKEILVERLMHLPVRKMVFNHIGPHWTDGKEDDLKELTASLPYPVVIAHDGTEIEL